MKKAVIAAIASASLYAGAAQAQEGYGGILGGWVSNNSQSWQSGTAAGKVKTSFDDGYNVSVFGGYNYGNTGNGSLRTELELSWRDSSVKNHKVNGNKVSNPKGKMTERAGFVNAFYDFDGNGSQWVPFVGAGIGYGQVTFDNYGTGSTTLLDDRKNLWGYQLIAGVGYDFTPTTRVFVDYRYRGYQEAKVRTESGSQAKITPNSNSLNVGLLFSF